MCNGIGKLIQICFLVPPKPPKLHGLTNKLTGREGHTLEVSCVSEGGKPAPQLKWVREIISQILDCFFISTID